jgi:hypothetical protein
VAVAVTTAAGMVQANVGQKLVNRNIFTSFFVVQLRVVSRYFYPIQHNLENNRLNINCFVILPNHHFSSFPFD